MRVVVASVLLLLASLPSHSADRDTPLLTWLGPDGAKWSWSPGSHASPAVPLSARRWHATQLDLEIPLLGGGSFSIAETRGQVLVLEFWASWCSPCWETLPALEALFQEEGERGLAAIAINAKEPAEVARSSAESLELTLPVGMYTDEMHELFRVLSLPTAIVVDRKGRVRGRWNRHVKGSVEELSDLVRRLLDETEDEEPDPTVARVVKGAGLLEADWIRRTTASASGLLVLPAGTGELSGILASLGESLILYGHDGRTLRDWAIPSTAGLLRHGDGSLVGFRPGGQEVVLLSLPGGETEAWELPAPVFDVVSLHPPGTTPEIVAATSDSVMRFANGEPGKPQPGSGLASSLAWSGSRADGRLAALYVGGPGPSTVVWLDRSLRETARAEGPADAWRLVGDAARPGEVGVTPPEVTAAVVGRFVEGGSAQVALATGSGDLVLLDLGSGKELFLASWEEGSILHLAAGDLDGDGLDELAAAVGLDLLLLTGRISQE